jgi:hypothetical protein
MRALAQLLGARTTATSPENVTDALVLEARI